MTRNCLLCLLFSSLLSACSTMHFSHGGREPAPERHAQWHHTGIFQLLELSQPVDLAQQCRGGDWARVTTQMGPLEVLLGSLDLLLVRLEVWQPWAVRYHCAQAQ